MRVHHIGYLVKNINKSIDTFANLGFTVCKPAFFDESRKADICFLENDGYCVELIAPAPESDLSGLLKQYPNMPYHLCYTCDNLEQSVEELKKKKFLLFKDIAPAPAISEKARVAFLINASGGIVELVEL